MKKLNFYKFCVNGQGDTRLQSKISHCITHKSWVLTVPIFFDKYILFTHPITVFEKQYQIFLIGDAFVSLEIAASPRFFILKVNAVKIPELRGMLD